MNGYKIINELIHVDEDGLIRFDFTECFKALTKYEEMKAALEKIERWELPAVTLSDGTVCSYGIAYGSNGERDFMRAIASKALKGETK